MLTFIKETTTVWERMLTCEKPIVLYGMGNGADKILDWCEAKGVQVAGVFASDDFVRGQSFRGFKVAKYSEMVERYEDFLLVIAFASESPQVIANFYTLASRHETVAPHLPLFAGEEVVTFAWLAQYEEKLQFVYDRLADDKSRAVFADMLNYKLSGKLEYLSHNVTEREADCRELFAFGQAETYLDLGAYNGDTVSEFLRFTGGAYQEVIAVEPDVKNFKKLTKFKENAGLKNLELVNKGIWKEADELLFSNSGGRQSTLATGGKVAVAVDSIDHILGARSVSYIKMDVEGVEYEALEGGAVHIGETMPKLFVAAYHHDADLWRLPQLIWQLAPYKVYLRRHPYVPAWEINFLCKR